MIGQYASFSSLDPVKVFVSNLVRLQVSNQYFTLMFDFLGHWTYIAPMNHDDYLLGFINKMQNSRKMEEWGILLQK